MRRKNLGIWLLGFLMAALVLPVRADALLAQTDYDQARQDMVKGQYDKAIVLLKQSQKEMSNFGQDSRLMQVRWLLYTAYFQSGDYLNAQGVLSSMAEAMTEEPGDSLRRAWLADNLALVYRHENKPLEVALSAKYALEIRERYWSGDYNADMTTAMQNMADAYKFEGQDELAKALLDKVDSINQYLSGKPSMPMTLKNKPADGAVAVINDSEETAEEKSYLEEMVSVLKKDWQQPTGMSYEAATAQFVLSPDGHPSRFSMAWPADDQNFNQSLVSMFSGPDAVSFQKPPASLQNRLIGLSFMDANSAHVFQPVMVTGVTNNWSLCLARDGWDSYMADMQKTIRAGWHPPKNNTDLKAVLYFDITANGSIKRIRVKVSSGDRNYDANCIEVLKSVAPLPRFPEKCQAAGSVTVEFTFDYRMKQS